MVEDLNPLASRGSQSVALVRGNFRGALQQAIGPLDERRALVVHVKLQRPHHCIAQNDIGRGELVA